MPDPGSDAHAPSPNVETHPLAPETPHSLEIDVDVDSRSGRRSSAAAQAALSRRRTRQLSTAAIVVWVLAACVFALAFTRHPRHAAAVAKRSSAPPAHVAMHAAPTTTLAKAAEEKVASPSPPAEPSEATPPPAEGTAPSEATPPPGEATPAPGKANSEQGRGKIAFPASAAGHRIYVDGHLVGDGPAPVDVSCGDHKVRVGSKGQWRAVHVPCGGVLSLD